jgi:transposase-like protein
MDDVIRYSEAFKLQIVRELEQGKLPSVNAAQEAYGIRGSSTVGRWVRKYGKSHLQRKVLRAKGPARGDP